jgi:hypothetical protein
LQGIHITYKETVRDQGVSCRAPTSITVFFALEDEFGLTDVTMFEEAYKKWGSEIFIPSEGIMMVRGKLNKRGRGLTIIADQAKLLPLRFPQKK